MDASDNQILDIDEARLIISLKNDDINNMKSSIKANQFRMNLKIADFQYKIQHLQNKVNISETKFIKSEQSLKKQKEKHQQQFNRLHVQNQKLKQIIEHTVNQSKQKQRELKGALYEQKIKLQKQRQINYKWVCQFEIISKYFDPKKILPLLEKDKFEDLPTYVDLYRKYNDSQQIIKHSNLQLSNMRSQIMSQMQESFQKLSSYESVMWDLKVKNQQLRNKIKQKQNELILRSEEINEKNSLLQAVQVQAGTQIQQLNSQLITLQKQFLNQKSEDQKVRVRSKTDMFYIERIQDIQQKYQISQTQYSQQIIHYEQKTIKLEQENRLLKNQLQELLYKLAYSEQLQIINSNNFQKQLEDKKKVIELMQASFQDQEDHLDELKRQNEKLVKELNQIILSKRKILQQYKIADQEYKMHFISLNQQIDHLRNQLHLRANSSKKSESSQKNQIYDMMNQSTSQKNSKVLRRIRSGEGSVYNLGNSRNLLFDLDDKIQLQANGQQARSNVDLGHYQEDPTWPQKYYSLLQKHNAFVKRVFTRLKGIKQKQN